MTLRILSRNRALQIMPFRKLGGIVIFSFGFARVSEVRHMLITHDGNFQDFPDFTNQLAGLQLVLQCKRAANKLQNVPCWLRETLTDLNGMSADCE